MNLSASLHLYGVAMSFRGLKPSDQRRVIEVWIPALGYARMKFTLRYMLESGRHEQKITIDHLESPSEELSVRCHSRKIFPSRHFVSHSTKDLRDSELEIHRLNLRTLADSETTGDRGSPNGGDSS